MEWTSGVNGLEVFAMFTPCSADFFVIIDQIINVAGIVISIHLMYHVQSLIFSIGDAGKLSIGKSRKEAELLYYIFSGDYYTE